MRDRRLAAVAAVLVLSLVGWVIPAAAQDASPEPSAAPEAGASPVAEATGAPSEPRPTPEPRLRGVRGGNMALTIFEVDPIFFADTFDTIRGNISDTYLRRASVADQNDAYVAMLVLRNRDVAAAVQERLGAFDEFDIGDSQTFMGSVARQRARLDAGRFDHVGFVIAADTDYDAEEPPRLQSAINRLRRTPGVLLTARGVGAADVIVIYQIGSKLRQAGITAQNIDRILRTSFLEPLVEGVLLPEPS